MKIVAIVLAVLFFVVAGLYWTGHLQALASKPGPHHSHALVCVVLGVLSLVWLRFQSASATAPSR